MKNIFLRNGLIAILIVCVVFAFSACNHKKDTSNDKTKATAVTYTNEKGQTQEELNDSKESFLGTWVGTSESTEYLYGSISLTINEDNTFDADVSDEKFSGTWEKIDGGIKFDSVYISGEMYFGKKCKMVIYEEDVAPVVLEKVD